MNDDEANVGRYEPDPWTGHFVAPPFVAPEILEQADLPRTREKLAAIIEREIVPRLLVLHGENRASSSAERGRATQQEIATLAALVLDPNVQLSADFILNLKDRNLSMEGLFVSLLEPTARYLGTMWENDECDFIDVTLGVARLQQLLSMFNASHKVPALTKKRRVCMMTIEDEKHSFGVSMVEKFLRAGGWHVHSERGAVLGQVISLMATNWYAVAGLTIGTEERLDDLAAIIRSIRQHSRNPTIGIMVGGPPFAQRPELAARVGADATAIDAPTAVLLAQKLFDIGAKANRQAFFS